MQSTTNLSAIQSQALECLPKPTGPVYVHATYFQFKLSDKSLRDFDYELILPDRLSRAEFNSWVQDCRTAAIDEFNRSGVIHLLTEIDHGVHVTKFLTPDVDSIEASLSSELLFANNRTEVMEFDHAELLSDGG